MLQRHCFTPALLLGLTMFGCGLAHGQDYPSKPIRIVTTGAGGGSDFAARQAAQGISDSLGQPVVIDNRPSILVGEIGAKAPPDGYNLVVHGGSFWLTPILQQSPYDVERDFAPISLISREVFILVTHPSLPVKSVKELIAIAQARPGQLNYSSSTPGGPQHLGVELLKSMAGVNIVAVPYKGTAPAVNALLTGEAHLTIGDMALVLPHAKTGRMRALAVTSVEPSALAPGLPTVAASGGLPGYEMVGATGIWTQSKTPPAVINRLSQVIVRHLNRPEVKERFLSVQTEVVASSPEQFAARIKSDIAKWTKVIRDSGIKKAG